MLAFIGQKIRASQIPNQKSPKPFVDLELFLQAKITFGFGSHGAKSLSVIMLIMLESNLIKSQIHLWQEILN